MRTRIRTASVAITVLVVGLSIATAGCGRYSFRNLKAMRSFKEANDHYRSQRFKEAIASYEAVIAAEPDYVAEPNFLATYFFLGHSYDSLFKPARKGEADNDALMAKAIQNYTIAAERAQDPLIKRRSLEYLVAAYASDKLDDPGQAEPIIQKMIALDPSDPTGYHQLAKIYEDAGRYEEAEATLMKARDARPNDPLVYQAIAGYYNRQGEFEKTMEAFQKAADLEPNNPQGYHMIGSYYQEKVQKDFRISDAQKKDYVLKGIAAEDKAIQLNPNYFEAVLWKNILLRQQARLETDRKMQEQLLKQADDLLAKAKELQKAATSTGKPGAAAKPTGR
jgi:tetratricopeptide (TPR) repeat protein